jgi:hypothetical protein
MMGSDDAAASDQLPVVDIDFLKLFMPYELQLAQRRAMLWGSPTADSKMNAFIGLYLIRLEPLSEREGPDREEAAGELVAHLISLLRKILRESDIPARLSDRELLAVLRDVDPQSAYVVAQRFLTSAGDSDLLRQAGMRTRVGFIVYPLSPQPNFQVERWHTLLELARRMARRGSTNASACGFGLLRGHQMVECGIPEADLIPLAFENLDPLVKAGILQVQRIQLLSGMR